MTHICATWIRLFKCIVTPEEHSNYSADLWGLLSSGVLRTNIHAEYPFTAEGVRQAHIDLTTGTTSGKLLIKVANQLELPTRH